MDDARLTTRAALDLIRREITIKDFDCPRRSEVTLPNGWAVSIGYDRMHYCDRSEDPLDCEIAIFTPDHGWFHHFDMDQVFGHVSAATMLRVIDAVSQAHRHPDICPCPICVEAASTEKETHRG